MFFVISRSSAKKKNSPGITGLLMCDGIDVGDDFTNSIPPGRYFFSTEGRMVSTGQVAFLTIRSAVLPNSMCSTPV